MECSGNNVGDGFNLVDLVDLPADGTGVLSRVTGIDGGVRRVVTGGANSVPFFLGGIGRREMLLVPLVTSLATLLTTWK